MPNCATYNKEDPLLEWWQRQTRVQVLCSASMSAWLQEQSRLLRQMRVAFWFLNKQTCCSVHRWQMAMLILGSSVEWMWVLCMVVRYREPISTTTRGPRYFWVRLMNGLGAESFGLNEYIFVIFLTFQPLFVAPFRGNSDFQFTSSGRENLYSNLDNTADKQQKRAAWENYFHSYMLTQTVLTWLSVSLVRMQLIGMQCTICTIMYC